MAQTKKNRTIQTHLLNSATVPKNKKTSDIKQGQLISSLSVTETLNIAASLRETSCEKHPGRF